MYKLMKASDAKFESERGERERLAEETKLLDDLFNAVISPSIEQICKKGAKSCRIDMTLYKRFSQISTTPIIDRLKNAGYNAYFNIERRPNGARELVIDWADPVEPKRPYNPVYEQPR